MACRARLLAQRITTRETVAVSKYLDYLLSLSPVVVGSVGGTEEAPLLVPVGSGVTGSSVVTQTGDLARATNKRFPGTPGLQSFGGGTRATNINSLGIFATGFTVVSYIRLARFSPAGWDRIISFGTAFINNEVIFSRDSTNTRFNLSFWNGTASTPNAAISSPSGSLVEGAFYHVAGIYERSSNQLRLYINGVLSATATGITSMADASSRTNVAFSCPTSGTGAEFLNGMNFCPAVFNKVLSASQILDLSNLATASRPLSGNAKYADSGVGVTRVVGIHKESGASIFAVTPASNGDWSAEAGSDDVHIAYLGGPEYAPQLHGPY